MGLTTRIFYVLHRADGCPVPTPNLIAACRFNGCLRELVENKVWHTLLRLERHGRIARVGRVVTEKNRTAVAWVTADLLLDKVRRLGGTMTDKDLAALLGTSKSGVTRRRQMLGIPAHELQVHPDREPTWEELERIEAEQRLCLPAWWHEPDPEDEPGRGMIPWTVPLIRFGRRWNGKGM